MTDHATTSAAAATPTADAASRPVRFALVGAGGIAGTHATAAASLNGRAVIAAVADPAEPARAKVAGSSGATPFESADAMLAAIKSGDVKADALFVCTPPSVRTQAVKPALELGLDVIVEKPLAKDPSEARALVDLAKSHPDRVCAVAYCHRFAPAILEMKRLTAAGKIGRLTRFENAFAFHHPPMAERWFSDPAVSGGGSLIDTGCHSLDIFSFLVGPPTVRGCQVDHDWEGRGDSSATLLVRSNGGENPGVAGVILSGWLEATRFHVALVGTGGTLFYDYEKPTELFFTGPDGTKETIEVETHDVRFARQLDGMASAVAHRTSAREAGLAGFDDGLIVAEAVANAHQAASVI